MDQPLNLPEDEDSHKSKNRRHKSYLFLGRVASGKSEALRHLLTLSTVQRPMHVWAHSSLDFHSIDPLKEATYYTNLLDESHLLSIIRNKKLYKNCTLIFDDIPGTKKFLELFKNFVQIFVPKLNIHFYGCLHSIVNAHGLRSVLKSFSRLVIPLALVNKDIFEFLQKYLKLNTDFNWPQISIRGIVLITPKNNMIHPYYFQNILELNNTPKHIRNLALYLHNKMDSIYDRSSLILTYKGHVMHLFDVCELLQCDDQAKMSGWIASFKRHLARRKVLIPACYCRNQS